MGPVHDKQVHIVQPECEEGAVHSLLGSCGVAVLGHELAGEVEVAALNHLLLEDQPQGLPHLNFISITVHMPALKLCTQTEILI